jgi:hypothetical protein
MYRRVLYLCGVMLLLVASSAFAFPAIDLTAGQTDVSGVDGTIWSSNVTQPTGTGVYNPFLRVQNSPTEEGFNTDAGSPQPPLDDKAGIWTHSVQWNTLATVTIGSTDYYSFQLDANEPQSGTESLISLDKLKIYTSSDPALSSLGGLTPLYDMDAISDQTVYIETALKPGSGTDDVTLYIPKSFFTSVSGTDYMYFYTQFGLSDLDPGLVTDATFEEWRGLQGPGNEVPEPSTVLLLGSGLIGLMGITRRKK